MRRRCRDDAGLGGHLVAAGPDGHAARRPGDAGDRGRGVNCVAETLGEPERDPVVAADDAVTGEVAEAGRAFGERRRVLIVELVPGRDSQAGGDRRASTRRGHEPLERIRDRATARLAERRSRRFQLLAGDRRPVAGLAVAVERALLEELEPEPRGRLPQDVVAGEDELRAELHNGAVLEPRRMDTPADAVPRLEHQHLGAACRERLRRREPGKAGANDDDPTQGRSRAARYAWLKAYGSSSFSA